MATTYMGLREDLYSVTVTITGVDGKKWTQVFDKMDGGDVSAKETKYRPGNGTVNQHALGGANEVSNITCTVLMTYAIYTQVPWLMRQNGKAKMAVAKQPLDENGSPYGKALNYTGRLQSVNPPKTDSESDSPGLLSLTQSSVTPVTTG